MKKTIYFIPAWILLPFLIPAYGNPVDEGLNLIVTDVTETTAALSWEFAGGVTAGYDYIVTPSGTQPDATTLPEARLIFGSPQYSELWGEDGDEWVASGRLRDVTDAGYRNGDEPIPEWPIGVNVKDFGAVGDGLHDDTQALRDAIAACPESEAVYLPNGTYIITGQVDIDKNYIVVRGQDMYETVLKFPMGLREAVGPDGWRDSGGFMSISGDVNLYNGNGTATHRSIENLTFEFPAIPNAEGHFSDYGSNAISMGGVKDSWIRNIAIKNCNNGIIMNTLYATVMNIEFDNFPGRVVPGSGDLGHAGHTGVKVLGSRNVIHDVTFHGSDTYEHSIGFNNLARNNVISRIRGADLQIDDHGGNVDTNCFTEINLGEGSPEVGRPTYRGSHEYSVWWNIAATDEQVYGDPDKTSTSVIVGLQTTESGNLTDPNFWHETKIPELLYPQNIYLAQMQKLNKEGIPAVPGPEVSPDSAGPRTIQDLAPETSYHVYARSHNPGAVPSNWIAIASFSTLEAAAPPPTLTGIVATDNANFESGSQNRDASETLKLRNAYGYNGDDYAYLRFTVDAANDAIGGIGAGAIDAVALRVTVISATKEELNIMVLADLADADAIDLDGDPNTDTYLSETTWNAINLTGQNKPDGDRQSPNDLTGPLLANTLDGDLGLISTPQEVLIPLDLALFQSAITGSSNDEITLIITGPKDQDLVIASLSNTGGHTVPSLVVTSAASVNPLDEDGDGIADAWETTYFSGQEGAIDGTVDSDGDGVLDFFEYLYGSNPTDRASAGFKLSAAPDGGTVTFTWEVDDGFVLGRDYLIEYCADLSNPAGWQSLPPEHYTAQASPSVVESRVQFQLEITHEYGSNVFIRLRKP